ncbi:MAG TPA: hypothetical protein VHT34_05775, partial [Clostridia bacterium]|nr:hypothetical protein [Clostridia bacterium]
VGFVGADSIDVILYLTRIFANLKYKTSIIDASDEQLLRYSVPEESSEELTYRSVDVYFDKNTSDKLECVDYDKYDAVIINYGFNHKLKEDMKQCNSLIVLTDFDRVHVLKLKETLDKLDVMPIVKIYRNVLKTKISSKYIDTILNIKKFKIEKEYLIPFSSDDQKVRLISQYDDIFAFSDISDKLFSFMIELVETHMSFDNKTFSKALKKAEKGC